MEQQSSKDEQKDWAEVRLDRVTTTNRICSNLVGAGILLPSELDRYKAVLQTYDPMTLVRVMIVSWQLREAHEEAQH